MKRVIKNIYILILIFIVVLMISSNFIVFGFDTTEYNPYGDVGTLPTGVEDLLQQGLGIVQVVAGFVAVISTIWLGVNFMKESPQGKVESRKKGYLILTGAVIIFGASKVLEFIATTVNKW